MSIEEQDAAKWVKGEAVRRAAELARSMQDRDLVAVVLVLVRSNSDDPASITTQVGATALGSVDQATILLAEIADDVSDIVREWGDGYKAMAEKLNSGKVH